MFRGKITEKAKKMSGNSLSPLVIHILNQILLLQSCNLGTQSIQAGVDIAVATVNLLNILDCACTLGAHGGDEQCYSGTNIGRGHLRCTQAHAVVMANDRCAVWVAEDNLCAHINEFIDKEQAALEHLLVNEYSAFGLCCNNQED
jgi:hypothetical protein